MADKKKKNRAKASKLISKYLEEIAKEEDAFIDDSDGGRMGTKAEALSRLIWKYALGYTEEDPKAGVKIIHPPSLSHLKILLDRIEGRVTDVNVARAKKTIADRIKDTTKSRLNKIAEDSVE
ncbi:hypothetical protein LCGC14_1468320 [marine sediment metagenome]|uniref:Uncharacterized protein n=1 Tax=marine sediment metagenome TaxID=412755 RepID=A0A0F9MEY8_9ZZZZ